LPAATSGAGAVEGGGYGSGGYGVGGYGIGGVWIGIIMTLTVRVDDADSHEPIANAKVDLEQPRSPGVSSNVVYSTTTGATGDAVLSVVSSLNSLTVSKDGYESVRKSLALYLRPHLFVAFRDTL
jgi:hypothetical protein